ncbi:MAG: RNA polymerase sigma factor, partial [Pyrinomonadaceae bacterium]
MEQRAVMAEPIINERVIKACQQGDREAFRLLFEAYKDKVFSIAVYSCGGDQTCAGDVTQQVFLKLMSNISQFHGESQFTTWLYRMVTNACIDEQRKRKRFLPFADSSQGIQVELKRPQEKRYAKLELADSVRHAIAELKPKFRIAIVLRYIEDLSYEEMASILHCSKGTVASRLNRGHKELARLLAHLRDDV